MAADLEGHEDAERAVHVAWVALAASALWEAGSSDYTDHMDSHVASSVVDVDEVVVGN